MEIKIETDPLESDIDSFFDSTADSFDEKDRIGRVDTNRKDKRKVWTKQEIMLFLSCYAARKDEFLNPRKKCRAFANVLKDMKCQGFMDQTINVSHLYGKMRTLQASYKNAKKKHPDKLPPTDEYLVKMEEIFDTPLTSSDIQAQESNSTESYGLKELDEKSMPSPPATAEQSVAEEPEAENPNADEPEAQVSEAEEDFVPKRRHRKTVKEKYYERKLELKVQRLAQQKEFMKEMKNMIKSELEKLNAIEEKKLKILENLINEKK